MSRKSSLAGGAKCRRPAVFHGRQRVLAGLELVDLSKTFRDFEAVKSVSLTVEDGEFAVFVGPSGCGKSTLLRLIAGLDPVTSGRIALGGLDVTKHPAGQRGVAMVFQSYALYPHMSVFDNIAFPLQMERRSKDEIRVEVQKAAETVRLATRLDDRPAKLSGGQRQRVAIARAIVRKPLAFLMDEPLSNLDAALRAEMRTELTSLHRRLGTTMIYVTHDQLEAMTMADKIVVLNEGRVEQIGRPMDLYHSPANRFVAGFIGSPPMNMLPVTVIGSADGETGLEGKDIGRISLPSTGTALKPGATMTLGIRPEAVLVHPPQDEPGLALKVTPYAVERLGLHTIAHTRLDALSMICLFSGDPAIGEGETLEIWLPYSQLRLFDGDGLARTPPTAPRRASATKIETAG